MKYKELKIIYWNGQPEGIRAKCGYIIFFPPVHKYVGQEERYKREIQEREDLAEYLLEVLKKPSSEGFRGLT